MVRKYTPDRKGVAAYLNSSPELRECLRLRAELGLATARALVHKRTGETAASGHVEDLGTQPVINGDPRMTFSITFDAPQAVPVVFHDAPNVAYMALRAAVPVVEGH